MRDASSLRPKPKAVIEGIWILVHELHCPRGTTVYCLIDTKIRWQISNRKQIRNFGAEALHIAELQRFGARYQTGVPRLSAVRGYGERAVATGCPNHLRVDR